MINKLLITSIFLVGVILTLGRLVGLCYNREKKIAPKWLSSFVGTSFLITVIILIISVLLKIWL